MKTVLEQQVLTLFEDYGIKKRDTPSQNKGLFIPDVTIDYLIIRIISTVKTYTGVKEK